jgi:hypothetical protein
MNYRIGRMIQESEEGKKMWRYRVDGRIIFLLGWFWGLALGWLAWGVR